MLTRRTSSCYPAVTGAPQLDRRRSWRLWIRYRVAYVLVGGYAAQLHGARRPPSYEDLTRSAEQRLVLDLQQHHFDAVCSTW